VLADKGYDSEAIVDHIGAMGAVVNMPQSPTTSSNASTTKTSIDRETVSNAASHDSNISAASPPDTRNSNPTSLHSSLSPAHGYTFRYMLIPPSLS